MVTCLTHGLMGEYSNLRGYGEGLSILLPKSHSINIAQTRDPHCQLFKASMEGYLEATHPKIGVRKRKAIVIMLKMINHGYFLLIIQLNSKLSKVASNMLSETIISV